MTISKEDYKNILEQQLDGKLTIFIDNSGFRKFLFDSKPDVLSEKINEKLHGRLKVIKILSCLDILALIASIILAIPSFGWFSLLFNPVLIISWFIYRGFSSWRKQTIWPVPILIIHALFASIFLSFPNIWVRLIIITSTLVFAFVRTLYFINSKIVFDLIHSNYKFFSLFYEKSKGALMPLIWTDPEYFG